MAVPNWNLEHSVHFFRYAVRSNEDLPEISLETRIKRLALAYMLSKSDRMNDSAESVRSPAYLRRAWNSKHSLCGRASNFLGLSVYLCTSDIVGCNSSVVDFLRTHH